MLAVVEKTWPWRCQRGPKLPISVWESGAAQGLAARLGSLGEGTPGDPGARKAESCVGERQQPLLP